MIDTDKYGMTNEELLKRYSHLSVDDYKELLAEVERLRLVIKNVADFPKKCPPNLKLKGVIDAMRCMLLEVIE